MGRSLVLFAATLAALLALTGFQATSETAATRLLGRLFGALIEIDRWLPVHQDDLQAVAADATRDQISLPDFALPVGVSREAVAAWDYEALRSEILADAGLQLYRDGRDAFGAEGAVAGDLALDEPARWAIDLLGEGMHGFWTAALVVTAGVSGLLLALAAISTGRAGRRSLLSPIIVGAGVFVVGTLIARVVLGMLGGSASSPVDEEVARLAEDAAWIGTRAGFATALLALVLVALAYLLGEGRAGDPWPSVLDEASPDEQPVFDTEAPRSPVQRS